jgi:CRISPR-associated protein Csx17
MLVLRVKQQPDAMPSITLNGCAPIPLAHYLKALGILRLVSEQADRNATGHWQGEQFILNSHLDCASLTEFFLCKYQPTPVLNPWNGDGGFFEDSRAGAVEVLKAVTESTSDRFAPYPWVLGDTYDELIESLSRLADAGLTLHIGTRKDWPSQN